MGGLSIKKTVDLARAEFISTHRPKIRIRRISPIGKLLPNTRTNLTIEAANIGDSKATITEIGFDIYIEGQQFNATAALSKFQPPAARWHGSRNDSFRQPDALRSGD